MLVCPPLLRFGRHTKGALRFWPDDDHGTKVADLNDKDSILLDTNQRLQFFDGRKAHSTQAYKGNRTSVIWYVAKGTHEIDDVLRGQAEQLGFNLPDASAACAPADDAQDEKF